MIPPKMQTLTHRSLQLWTDRQSPIPISHHGKAGVSKVELVHLGTVCIDAENPYYGLQVFHRRYKRLVMQRTLLVTSTLTTANKEMVGYLHVSKTAIETKVYF